MPAHRLTFNDHIDKGLARARETAQLANERRTAHRRSTPRRDPDRRQQLTHTIQAIDGRMKVLRSLIGRLPHERTTPGRANSLYRVSAELQYERRQIKKMLA